MAPPKGFRHSSEAIARIAAASRARKFSAESNLKKSLALKGKPLTAEHRAKLSAAKIGRPQTPEQKAGLRAKWLNSPRHKTLNLGRKLTAEHKAKIGAAGIGNQYTKGKPLTAEHKAKVSARLKGKPKTEAHKRAVGEAHKTSPRAAAARARAYLANPSSIELAVRALLNEWRVDHIPQKPFGRYVADIFVPSHNLVIECDGDYWHRNRTEADHARDSFMGTLGLRVLRLPESDIRSGRHVVAVKQILGLAM